jgi:hypothetical protein
MNRTVPGILLKLRFSAFFLLILLLNQPLYARQPDNPAGPLVEYSETFYSPICKGIVLYRHQLTYNAAGKVAVDDFSYFLNGKLASTVRFDYNYDDTGRLIARIAPHNQFKYYYSPEGRINRYEAYFLIGNQWLRLEETTITEKINASGEGRSLHLIVKKKSIKDNTTSVLKDTEYALDATGNITWVRLNRYANKPANATFRLTYDNHPNPLRGIFIERMFDQELENNGPANILSRHYPASGQSPAYRRDNTLEYNAAGYPVRIKINGNKLREYRYQHDPVQTPTDMLATLARIDTTANRSLLPTRKEVTCRLTDFTESFPHPVYKSLSQYKHHFEYDEAGRPVSHLKTNFEDGKKTSFTLFQYHYDQAGKLVSKTSRVTRQKFFYDEAGELNQVEVLHKRSSGEWVLYIRDQFTTQITPDKGKEIKQIRTINNANNTQLLSHSEYVLDAAGNIRQSKFNFVGSKAPVSVQQTVSTYAYDDKPNPLRNLYINHWQDSYQKENTAYNIVRKNFGNRLEATPLYEYNQFGYPVKAVSINLLVRNNDRTRRVEEYTYAIIRSEPAVPESEILALENSVNINIYPNPARTSFKLAADSLGQGTAEIRILDMATTRIHKHLTLPVADKLQTVIQVNDLAPGIYVVEVQAPKGVFARRLVVE